MEFDNSGKIEWRDNLSITFHFLTVINHITVINPAALVYQLTTRTNVVTEHETNELDNLSS